MYRFSNYWWGKYLLWNELRALAMGLLGGLLAYNEADAMFQVSTHDRFLSRDKIE